MGTYVHASIAYGFTVAEPEIDWDAGYDENAETPEPFDGWELVRDLAGIYCGSTGDSQWDETATFIYVASSRVTVDEDAVKALNPGEIGEPDLASRNALAAAALAVPSRLKIGEPGWHLYWSRG